MRSDVIGNAEKEQNVLKLSSKVFYSLEFVLNRGVQQRSQLSCHKYMASRFKLPTLGQRKESSFTESIVSGLRQGHTSAELIDYISPSKQRYRYFSGEGSWLRVIMVHPGAAMSKSSTKWDNIQAMSKWGWTNTASKTTFYSKTDGIGDLVGNTKGLEYQWVHSFEICLRGRLRRSDIL